MIKRTSCLRRSDTIASKWRRYSHRPTFRLFLSLFTFSLPWKMLILILFVNQTRKYRKDRHSRQRNHSKETKRTSLMVSYLDTLKYMISRPTKSTNLYSTNAEITQRSHQLLTLYPKHVNPIQILSNESFFSTHWLSSNRSSPLSLSLLPIFIITISASLALHQWALTWLFISFSFYFHISPHTHALPIFNCKMQGMWHELLWNLKSFAYHLELMTYVLTGTVQNLNVIMNS